MKFILLALALVGCSCTSEVITTATPTSSIYRSFKCVEDEDGCGSSDTEWKSLQDCREFARKANIMQPKSKRICVRK